MFDLYPYLRRQDPETFAPYYQFGIDYVAEVTREMGFDHDGLERTTTDAVEAMCRGRTEGRDDIARSVASVLIGDAEWFRPFAAWQSITHRVRNIVRTAPLIRALRSVGGAYANAVPEFEPPTFSRPEDVTIDGRPAAEYLEDAERRLVLATSLLHLEWYVDVARHHGVAVPADLVERTWFESKRYFAGVSDELSERVRDFQFWLFQDVHWIEKFERHYGGSDDAGASPVFHRVLEEDLS